MGRRFALDCGGLRYEGSGCIAIAFVRVFRVTFRGLLLSARGRAVGSLGFGGRGRDGNRTSDSRRGTSSGTLGRFDRLIPGKDGLGRLGDSNRASRGRLGVGLGKRL